MRVVAKFSFAGGREFIEENYANELDEIYQAIRNIDAEACKTKISKEKTMPDRLLYSPRDLNDCFKRELNPNGWMNLKVSCDYSEFGVYEEDYQSPNVEGAFRDMDFVKNKLGVEVQFGKYSFMVYNVCAKMTIFRNLGHINAGVEIVPVKNLSSQMSSGVSYFEQFAWDLSKRGVSNIDIPVLILGIDI